MKNIFLFFILFLFSCSEPLQQNWYELDSIPSELKNTDNAVDIWNWAVNNIDYKCYANGFHNAQKTLNEKEGNCANISILVLALNYKIRHDKGQLVYCNQKKGGLHYTVRIDNKIIEPEIIEIYNIIDFDEINIY